MRLSQEQCNAIAHDIMGSIRQYVLDNQDAYSRFLEDEYGEGSDESKDSSRTFRNLREASRFDRHP